MDKLDSYAEYHYGNKLRSLIKQIDSGEFISLSDFSVFFNDLYNNNRNINFGRHEIDVIKMFNIKFEYFCYHDNKIWFFPDYEHAVFYRIANNVEIYDNKNSFI